MTATTDRPSRPVLRYHGGKFMLRDWIISHFPAHRIYVEPFGGAGSILMAKPRVYSEVYNDMDGEVVSLFRVLRDPAQARELERQLVLTPYACSEFESAYLPAADPIEQARRTICKAYMGFGGSNSIMQKDHHGKGFRPLANYHRKPTTGFRSNSNRSGTTPAQDWMHYPEHIAGFCERLRGVVIENRPAIAVIQAHDTHDTLIYCDPPYPAATRDGGADYRFEMTDDDHRQLAEVLRAVQGMVLLSSYRCDLYDALYPDWQRYEKTALADGARRRVECLWLNPAAAASANGRLDL